MRVIDKTSEGYQPIYETEPGLVGRTAQALRLIRTRSANKRAEAAAFEAEIRRITLDPNVESPIDLEALSKQPIFTMNGFESQQAEPYPRGQEPTFAPLSKEQMTLLLAGIVPLPLLPFVTDRFVFNYEAEQPDESRAPVVEVKEQDGKKKIHITLNRSNFISRGIPASEREKAAPAQLRRMVGFVDPARISIYIGKILAELIPPPPPTTPEEQTAGDYGRFATLIAPKPREAGRPQEFWLTAGDQRVASRRNTMRLRRTPRRDPVLDNAALKRQWQDFIGLAVTAPDIAQQDYPELYGYFTGETETFNTSPEKDDQAIERLEISLSSSSGQLLENFNRIRDLRTEAEQQQDKGISPELAGYERFITGLNKGLAMASRIPLFGKMFAFRITYTVPESMERAEQLAADDKEVKKLIEQLDETIRDQEFVDILATSSDYDREARVKARRYLMAASQAGEFSEWRVFAWLHKFSKTFRDWGGQYIGEEDYKDIQLIYSQSEKIGNRLGTGVLPYKVRPLTGEQARFYGTRKAIYELRDRPEYIKEVEKKVKNKSPSARTNASDKAFDQFKGGNGEYIDFDEKFGDTPAGMTTQTVNLQELGLDPAVGRFLGQLGVGKISPDAKALAVALYEDYRERGMQSSTRDRWISGKALSILQNPKYRDLLNKPPEDRVSVLFELDAKALAKEGDFERINEQREIADQAKQSVMSSLGAQLRAEPYLNQILEPVREKLLEVLANGTTDVATLFKGLDPFILQYYQGIMVNVEVARRSIMRFLYDSRTIKNLILLQQIIKYEKDLTPAEARTIKNAAEQIAKVPTGEAMRYLPEQLTYEQLEEYTKLGLELTSDDLERIKNADRDILIATTPPPAAGQPAATPPETNTDIRDNSEAKNKKRALILAEKLTGDKVEPALRERIITDTVKRSIAYFQRWVVYAEPQAAVDLAIPDQTADNRTKRFNDWADTPMNKIFAIPALRSVKNQLSSAVALSDSDDPATQARGLGQLSQVLTELVKAINYEDSYLKATLEEKRGQGQRQQRPQRQQRQRQSRRDEEDEAEEEAAAATPPPTAPPPPTPEPAAAAPA